MSEGHGKVITSAQRKLSDRISLKAMELNTQRACTNTLWGCGVAFNDQLGSGMPNIAYTVGLAERGLPELVMLGNGEMPEFINAIDAVTRLWDDRDGYFVGPVPGVPSLRLVEIDAEQFCFGLGRLLGIYYHGRDVSLKVVQMVLVDERGLWPTDSNYPWNPGRAFVLPVFPFGGIKHATTT